MNRTLLILSMLCVLFACTKESKESAITLQSITLSSSKLELSLGASDTLKATTLPLKVPGITLHWSSSDSSIVKVNANGILRALNLGEAIVTVNNEESNVSSSCTVLVKPVVATQIVLNKTILSLNPGLKDTLRVGFEPANTTNQKVYWSSSNESIVKVDSFGNVEAIGIGEATITVKNTEGTVSAICSIVVKPIIATSLTLNKTSLSLLIDTKEKLNASVEPTNTTHQHISWSSSNGSVVTVDQEGNVYAKGAGSATITAKIVDGNLSASCNVTVKPILATGIILSKTAVTMFPGTTEKLSVSFEPVNTTNKSVFWSSSNESIIKIDQQGNVLSLAVGNANIVATAKDGTASAVCKVTVNWPVLTSLSIDKKGMQLFTGETVQYHAITIPTNANPAELVWSSSNNSVANISSLGLAKAIKTGTTTIKVSNKSGTISNTTTLTVTPRKVSSISFTNTTNNLLVGATDILTAIVLPFDADNKKVTWTSSNSNIVTVDNAGKITALGSGTAVISAQATDGSSAVAHCTVVVSTIDKFVKVVARPSYLSAGPSGNSVKLSTGIYNSVSSPITISSIKIVAHGFLIKAYSVNDAPLSSASYIYDLGSFALQAGAINGSNYMAGWSVQFEYKHQGTLYTTTVAVNGGSIGNVTANDFNRASIKSNLKPIKIIVRGTNSINPM